MAVIFHVKGTALNAVVSQAGKVPTQVGTITVDAGSGTGIIGDSIINLDQGNNTNNMLIYTGLENTPSTRAVSILIRCALSDITTFVIARFFHLGNTVNHFMNVGGTNWLNQGSVSILWNNNVFNPIMFDESGIVTAGIQGASGSFVPTLNKYHDIVLTYTGDTTVNGFKVFVDTILNFQSTSIRSWPISKNQSLVSSIFINNRAGTNELSRMKLNEFAIWNEVIDPTSNGLDLKGEDRTSFVASTDFDGLNSTDPGISNVLDTSSYIIKGVSKTGTLGASTDPGESNVSTGVDYTANGVSKTGTLDTVTNVLDNQSMTGANRTGTLTAS